MVGMDNATSCSESEVKGKRRGTGQTIFELGWSWNGFMDGVRHHYKIQERGTGRYLPWGPLFMRRQFQRELANELRDDLLRGGPCRWCVVKSRKVGASTYLAGMGLDIAQTLSWNVGILAHETAATENIFGIARTMYEKQTRAKPALRSSRTESLTFGVSARADRTEGDTGLMSRIVCGTAGGRHPLTSYTLHMLILDECAKYQLDDEGYDSLLNSVMGSVPTEGPSLVVKNSTANGQQGDFYDTVMQSLEDTRKGVEPQWRVFFRPWWFDEGNSMPPEEGYDWENWDKDDREREEMLTSKHGLTLAQLRFRRFQIRQLRNDVLNFDQEFPDSIMSAFKNPASPAIPRPIMEKLRFGVTTAKARYTARMVEGDAP